MKRKFLGILLALCMITVILPFSIDTVSAAGKQAWVWIPGANSKGEYTSLQITINEGETKYYITNANGLATAGGASADNYNIKLTYPNGGTPTMYLKNAKLVNSQWSCITIGRNNVGILPNILDFSFNIKVEADSTLIAPHRDPINSYVGYLAISATNTGDLTITGPGKLTCTTESNYTIGHNGRNLIFRGIVVDITSNMPVSWGVRSNIQKGGTGDVIIENCFMNLTANSGPCIVAKGEKNNILIRNGSRVTALNPSSSDATFSCTGEIVFDRSSVEITSKNKCFSPKPTLIGVGAVAGTNADNTNPYNEKKANAYKYFKCGTDITPLIYPTEPETQPTVPVTEATTPPTQVTNPVTEATTPPTEATTPPNETTAPATETTAPATTPTEGESQSTVPPETAPITTATEPQTDIEEEGEKQNVARYVVLGVLSAGVSAAAVILFAMKLSRPKNVAEE